MTSRDGWDVNMLASVAKKVFAAACGVALCWGSGPLHAEQSDQTVQATSRSYYGWLDKFENPSHQPKRLAQPPLPVQQRNAAASAKNPSRNQSAQENAASVPPASGSTEDAGVDVSDVVLEDVVFENDTAEPGKGLGCYYHRAYYSHLPLFKDDSYSLRGAFDVAETYHKPSKDIVSSPDEIPHK